MRQFGFTDTILLKYNKIIEYIMIYQQKKKNVVTTLLT